MVIKREHVGEQTANNVPQKSQKVSLFLMTGSKHYPPEQEGVQEAIFTTFIQQ
jgi:hypothetical protein